MGNYFEELNKIDVSGKTEKKNGLTYLSWAWAWGEVKKKHPDANYTVYENKDGLFYHTDGNTCWVKVGVTVNGIEHIEYLPVMDYRNASIPVSKVTSFDVNKAVQRALTKAIARHGLGLYIYAGEDLPEGEEKTESKAATKKTEQKPAPKEEKTNVDDLVALCKAYGVMPSSIASAYHVEYVDDMKNDQIADAMLKLNKKYGGNK